MSEKQEHKARYNRRLEYIAEFQKWVVREPSMMRLIAWRKWLKSRPVWKDGDT